MPDALAAALPFLLILAGFWLLIVRPAGRQRRAREQLLSAVGVGAEVVTTSGLVGTVVEEREDEVVLDVGSGIRLTFLRAAIGQVRAPEEPADPSAAPETQTTEATPDDAD